MVAVKKMLAVISMNVQRILVVRVVLVQHHKRIHTFVPVLQVTVAVVTKLLALILMNVQLIHAEPVELVHKHQMVRHLLLILIFVYVTLDIQVAVNKMLAVI